MNTTPEQGEIAELRLQLETERRRREAAEQQVAQKDGYIKDLQDTVRRLRCERWARLRARSCVADYRSLRHLYSMR